MKKFWSFLLAMCLLLGVCTTCAFAADESGKLTFYFWDANQQEAMQKVVDLFHADYPNVEVELTVIPWDQYWTKMQTSLNSPNGPDIFWLNFSFAREYVPMGLVEPLSDYIAADGTDLSVFPESLLSAYTFDNKVYGIPKDYDTIGMFYNKEVFDAAGLAYPTDDWTWNDMVEAAKKIKETGYTGIAFNLSDTQSWLFDLFVTNDTNILSEDGRAYVFSQPGVQEVFDFSMGLIADGLSPTFEQCQEIAPLDRFTAGMVGMYWTGSWNCQYIIDALGVDKVGVVEIPAKVKEGNVIHGLGICISAASPNKDLAWKFVKCFTKYEAAEAQASVVIPAHNEGSKLWSERFSTLGVDCFLKAAREYAIPVPEVNTKPAAQGATAIGIVQQIWAGQISVADGLAKIDEEIAKILSE